MMFDLDGFELDFDDDFSSNIFVKNIDAIKRNAVERNKFCNKSKLSNQTSSNSRVMEFQHTDTKISSSLDFPLMKENCLKRMNTQDEKQPQRKRLSHEGLLQRKFPGPAGLLPDKPLKDVSDLSLLIDKPCNTDKKKMEVEEEDIKGKEMPIIYSQSSGSVFLESSYQKLINDFNLNDCNNPLNKYTVEWVKKTALNKGFQGRKIPFLGLVIHSVNHSIPDPVLILRDPTGEINASLHREVWAEISGKLKVGVALALRQIGVLITGVVRRQIYLNVTMNNILSVYSPSENENKVDLLTINKVSKTELIKSFEEWLVQPSRNPPAKTSTPAPVQLFTTASDSRGLSKVNEQTANRKNRVEGSPVRSPASGGGRKTEEVLADLGIVFGDGDFAEEMSVPRGGPDGKERGKASAREESSSTALSRADSLIFEEVLSGIDLDEFEL